MSEHVTSHNSETSSQGHQVITACAFIHTKHNGVDTVFVPKRAATKKFLPGVYELPGGHIEFGEDMVEGLKREILEEFGMHIEVGDPFFVFTYENKTKQSHSIEVIYFATFTEPIENVQLDPIDHSEYGWFAEDDLDKIMAVNRRDDPEILAMRKAFSLLKGKPLNFGGNRIKE